ncbi:MAG: Pyocin activator protein PrtN [Pseudomonadales bacterium]|nr:Pyocin activator protein PrtN [Pseudomonadales bacterium]|tara:strand:+ start:44283 stop:44561 length:279 start_codon:yes stop_codon:yes gene_type:complete
MKTLFLLMAQYDGLAIIPLDKVCADYFCHLSVEKLQRKVMSAEIDLPIVRMEGSQKAAKGVHLQDLASYLDEQRRRAVVENDKLHGRFKRAS